MPRSKKPKKQYTQLDTPKKNPIIGAVEFANSLGVEWTRKAVALKFKATTDQVDYALKSDTERTKKSSELKAKNHEIITERDLDEIEAWLANTDFDGHTLNWNELCVNFELNTTGQALQQRMQSRNIFSFIACDKQWVDDRTAAFRVEWCKTMKARYPNKEDWRHVRFSDEVHFGWGPEGKIRIIRCRGHSQRGAPDCIQRREVKDKKEPLKRLHYWGAFGYGFKMDKLIKYDVETNTNGKMTQEVYINDILNVEVVNWLREPGRWTLEEDGDSGHGKVRNDNAIEKWKRAHGMSRLRGSKHGYYFNASLSPDLSTIEDGWSHPKHYVKKRPHWDAETVNELVQEGWNAIPQKWINKLCDSMPQRLQDCVDSRGQIVNMR